MRRTQQRAGRTNSIGPILSPVPTFTLDRPFVLKDLTELSQILEEKGYRLRLSLPPKT
jgi:hypothetical protein